MATTHDATAYSGFVSQAPPWGMAGGGGGGVGIIQFKVDMAAVAAYLNATIDGSSADVVQMWDIPAGTQILGVRVELITPEGAAATVAVGDGDNTAGYLAAFSINGAAGTSKMTLLADVYGAALRTYAATDTLDLLFGTAADIDVAVFEVQVLCAIFRRIVTPIW